MVAADAALSLDMMAWMPPLDSTICWTMMLAAENEGALP